MKCSWVEVRFILLQNPEAFHIHPLDSPRRNVEAGDDVGPGGDLGTGGDVSPRNNVILRGVVVIGPRRH
jgi:hypothetical protein